MRREKSIACSKSGSRGRALLENRLGCPAGYETGGPLAVQQWLSVAVERDERCRGRHGRFPVAARARLESAVTRVDRAYRHARSQRRKRARARHTRLRGRRPFRPATKGKEGSRDFGSKRPRGILRTTATAWRGLIGRMRTVRPGEREQRRLESVSRRRLIARRGAQAWRRYSVRIDGRRDLPPDLVNEAVLRSIQKVGRTRKCQGHNHLKVSRRPFCALKSDLRVLSDSPFLRI